MPTCCIYKYTNKINGKSYIGQTVNIYLRRMQHENPTGQDKTHQYNSEFHKDIRKYGIENFVFEILEECQQQELNNKEIYYINKYHSNINGYNKTAGGGGGWRDGKHVYQVEVGSGDIIAEYKSIRLAARNTCVNAGDIKRVCVDKARTSGGFIWCFVEDYDRDKFIGTVQCPRRPYVKNKPVYKIDIETNKIIKEYSSIHEAADKEGIDRANIYRCCQGKQKQSAGYVWKYKEV